MDVGIAAIKQLLPVLIIIFLLFAGLAFLSKRKGGAKRTGTSQFPFVRRPSLFTRAELLFLTALREAAPNTDVFGKVRLEDVIEVRPGVSNSVKNSERGRIRPRHLDFVLVEPSTTEILCAVELDDSSHASARARASDAFKDAALAAAGVPLIRVVASDKYDVNALRGRLESALHPLPKEAAASPR